MDDAGTHHLLIGLNRENIDALLRGEVFWLPSGAVPLNEDSEIVLVFAETRTGRRKALTWRGIV